MLASNSGCHPSQLGSITVNAVLKGLAVRGSTARCIRGLPALCSSPELEASGSQKIAPITYFAGILPFARQTAPAGFLWQLLAGRTEIVSPQHEKFLLSNLESSALRACMEHDGIDRGAVDVGKGAGPAQGTARSE